MYLCLFISLKFLPIVCFKFVPVLNNAKKNTQESLKISRGRDQKSE